MFSRFKISLFQPSKIANFQKDSKLITSLYYLLLALLATIPSVILIFSSIGLDYSDKAFIRKELRGIEIPYEIVDYKLERTAGNDDYYQIALSETITLMFTELSKDEIEYNPIHVGSLIIFTSDEVIYHSQILEVIKIKYSDYDSLKNLDLKKASSNDSEFWNTVFSITNDLIEEHSPRNRIINTGVVFLSSAIFLMLFSLLIAFFQRVRMSSILSFSRTWQLTIYTMTPYVIFTLIGDLYQIGILSFIGVIVSYIYANLMSISMLKK